MSSRGADSHGVDWATFRRQWSALVPLAVASLLAEVGAILSVLFRVPPPPPGSGPNGAVLYVLSLAPVPVLIACLLVGYVWARLALSIVLVSSAALMLANAGLLCAAGDTPSAFILAPFLLCALLGLRRVHAPSVKLALAELDAQRRLRWGLGHGWMLVLAMASIVATASLAILALDYVRVAGGPDWTKLAGPLRLAPVIAGGAVAAGALARMPISRSPMRWLLIGALALLVSYLVYFELDVQRRAFAATALLFDLLGLVALGRPSLHSYCERQLAKQTKAGEKQQQAPR